jgi:RNA recognition motif-containing protein
MRRLFVRELSFHTTNASLKAFFSQYGPVEDGMSPFVSILQSSTTLSSVLIGDWSCWEQSVFLVDSLITIVNPIPLQLLLHASARLLLGSLVFDLPTCFLIQFLL